MSPIRAIARPLLSAPFVADAVSRLRHPEATAASLKPRLKRWARRVPSVRAVADRPELFARVTGGVQAGAALLLAAGRAPRLSATLLVATQAITLPGDLATARQEDRLLPVAVTSAGQLGAALVASVDTGHHNKLKAVRSRAKKANRRAEKRVAQAESKAARAVGRAGADRA